MYTGQMVFSQLMDFLPRHEFNQCVRRYQDNYRLRRFSCLDQFLCMVFAQLTYEGRIRLKPIPMRFAASVTSIPIPGSAWSS